MRSATSTFVLISFLAASAGCGGDRDADNGDTVDATPSDGTTDADARDDDSDAAADESGDDSDADASDVPADADAAHDSDADSDAVDASDDASDADATEDATDAGAGGVDEEPWPDLEPGPVPATVVCAPIEGVCDEGALDTWTIRAGYRKDHYFPDDVYPEYTDPPLDGGRFHIVGVAAASGAVTRVLVDGVALTDAVLPPAPSVEWHHVWPDPVVEGAPVWVAFHSRSADWDARSAAQIRIETDGGVALDGEFRYDAAAAPVTWVTPAETGDGLLVFVSNPSTEPLPVQRVWIDGRDASAAGRVCGPDAVAPGATAMFRVATCAPPVRGAAWTVVVEYDGAPPSVAGGRHLAPHFVVEAWPVSNDCPVPTGEGPTDALERHLRAGFDTMYLYWNGGPPRCPTATPDIVNDLLPAAPHDMHVLIGDDFPYDAADAASLIRDSSRVAGFLTGDESDGEIYSDDGAPNAERKAARARRLWSLFPELTVYNGGMTNGQVGTFSGMADVQGMDVYTAACAPHITDGVFPPLRGPFDYLRNARNNHMPWPTWLYSQGLHGGWNFGPSSAPFHRQPDRQEILVQALSVLAAGGKGIMWFQTSLSEADHDPRRWEAITQSNRMVRAVRSWAREGDVMAPAPEVRGNALAEAIAGPRAIVVPVINLAFTEEVNDVLCISRMITDPSNPPHWILADQRVGVSVTVPTTSEVQDVFEVLPSGAIVDVDHGVDAAARVVRLPRVDLSNDVPVRLFVLHSGPEGRAEAAAAARLWGEAP